MGYVYTWKETVVYEIELDEPLPDGSSISILVHNPDKEEVDYDYELVAVAEDVT